MASQLSLQGGIHVGTGIVEMLYFTYFTTLAHRSGRANGDWTKPIHDLLILEGHEGITHILYYIL